jgi:hypothetical protein
MMGRCVTGSLPEFQAFARVVTRRKVQVQISFDWKQPDRHWIGGLKRIWSVNEVRLREKSRCDMSAEVLRSFVVQTRRASRRGIQRSGARHPSILGGAAPRVGRNSHALDFLDG